LHGITHLKTEVRDWEKREIPQEGRPR
jgi:hypothetical protein